MACAHLQAIKYSHKIPDKLLSSYQSKVYVLYDLLKLTQDEDDHLIMSFRCSKLGCKRKKPISWCEDLGSLDKGATGQLWDHAELCWHEAKVAEVKGASTAKEAAEQVKQMKQGKLTVFYENVLGKGQLAIGIRNQTFEQLQCVPLYCFMAIKLVLMGAAQRMCHGQQDVVLSLRESEILSTSCKRNQGGHISSCQCARCYHTMSGRHSRAHRRS